MQVTNYEPLKSFFVNVPDNLCILSNHQGWA